MLRAMEHVLWECLLIFWHIRWQGRDSVCCSVCCCSGAVSRDRPMLLRSISNGSPRCLRIFTCLTCLILHWHFVVYVLGCGREGETFVLLHASQSLCLARLWNNQSGWYKLVLSELFLQLMMAKPLENIWTPSLTPKTKCAKKWVGLWFWFF